MFQPREPGKDFHPGDRRRRRGIDASLSYIRAQMSERSSSLSFFPSFFPFFFSIDQKRKIFSRQKEGSRDVIWLNLVQYGLRNIGRGTLVADRWWQGNVARAPYKEKRSVLTQHPQGRCHLLLPPHGLETEPAGPLRTNSFLLFYRISTRVPASIALVHVLGLTLPSCRAFQECNAFLFFCSL